MADYIHNGTKYNLSNLKDYIQKDFWDSDDLKFDFWYRMHIHNMIVNKVLELNGIKSNPYTEDNSERLKKEISEKNKNIPLTEPFELSFIFDD
jgi:hypothetical protein